MFEKFAGLYTQIQNLKKKLKKLDTSKHTEKQVKEIVEALNILEERYEKEKAKRQEKMKAKEEAASEVQKEAISVPNAADVGAVSQNAPAPAAAPGAPAATPTTPDDQKVSCPLCGGLNFNDNATYQQHMEYTHASDIMPTNPGQKLDKTVASTDPAVDKVENDPKLAPGIIVPDSVKKHDEIVDKVEKDPKIAPHIISEEKTEPTFKLDDEVSPNRGSESTGKVMRWDGKPSDLVYVAWESGPLADRDGFGGYYPHDLKLHNEEPVEAAMPMEKPACADCTSMKDKHADLKGNYEALLKDLKEERDIHYTQGNSKWVSRLDQKIRDLEKSISEKFGDGKEACSACGQSKESGAQNAEELTIMDHTPPRANSGPDAGGKDSHDEFQDEWAMPAGIEMESAKKYTGDMDKDLQILMPSIVADGVTQDPAISDWLVNRAREIYRNNASWGKVISKEDNNSRDTLAAFMSHWLQAKQSGAPMGDVKTSALSAPITTATKLSVFNKEFVATPVNDQKKFGGYDISQNGKKLFKINSKDSQPMTKEQLEFCAQIELTRGLKQAKLTEKIAFLEAGSKVYILATDKPGKRIKFASMEQGLRGWAPVSKFAFISKEGEMRKHKDHIDNTFGHNGKEILVDCPNGSGNMVWLPMGEVLPISQPPATPESLNEDLGAESAKECADCHGTFEGAEGASCPTCGRFAVQKEAGSGDIDDPLSHVPHSQWGRTHKKLKPTPKKDLEKVRLELDPELEDESTEKEALRPALAPQILNRRTEVNASLNKVATVTHREDGWHVLSEKGKNLGGPYKSKAEAVKRLRQVEYFKHHGAIRPFSRKVIAEVMSDPYQSLTDHITDMKSRMNQVQDRLQTTPVVKAAVEDAAPEMDLPGLFADLTQGIELLETKLGGDDIEPELHKGVEELENRLWELEEKLGLTPEISEHEKAEPEHKEIVEDMDKEADTAAPAATTGTPISNVQPTDNDNLEIPVPMPTSPPPPGQKWVYNSIDKAYVLMPDTTDPSKLV